MPHTVILGSMTTKGKIEAIKFWQTPKYFGNQLVVGMCGDGGNDSGAVRAADIRIILANTEMDVVMAMELSTITQREKNMRDMLSMI